MKKIYWIGMGILLITFVTAGAIILSNATYDVPEYIEPVRYSGEITFLADGKPASCYLNERDMNIGDDFEDCLEKNFGGKRITNAQDWTRRDWKQIEVNGTIYRSFNEDKLNDLVEKINGRS